MLPEDFRHIEKYFTDNGMAKHTAHFAFLKYIENVENALEDQKKAGDAEIRYNELRSVCKNYLIEANLKNYLDLSRVNMETEDRRNARRYASTGFKKIITSIITGVASSYVFILTLIAIYAVAKDQIESIFRSLDFIP